MIEQRNCTPLFLCSEGDSVTISSIDGSGVLKKRMLELGFTPGTPIRILRFAPFKDPIEVKIKPACVSLKIAEAQHNMVVCSENSDSVHSDKEIRVHA